MMGCGNRIAVTLIGATGADNIYTKPTTMAPHLYANKIEFSTKSPPKCFSASIPWHIDESATRRSCPILTFPRKIVFQEWRNINVTFQRKEDEDNTEAGIHTRI